MKLARRQNPAPKRKHRGLLTIVVLALMVSVLVIDVEPAQACSCTQPPPTAPLDELDAAFVGIPREVVGHVRRSSSDLAIVRFEVIEAVKGQVGSEAFVLVNDNFTSCGDPRFIPGGSMFGKESGIQIWNPSVPIASEACTSTSPDYVRNGVPGLDQPVRGSPAVALAAGEHRGTSIRLLNADAEVSSYVASDGEIASPSMCADHETLATLTDGPTIRWRSLLSLSIIAETTVTGIPDELRELTIDRCVQNNAVLLRSQTQRWLVLPDGTVTELQTGQNNSGTVSDDGTLFARWNDTFEFEVLSLSDPGEASTKVSVPNHRGQDLEISPDGSMFAFYRRKPPLTRGDMEVVIVDGSGTELHVLLDPSFFSSFGIRWFDDNTLAVGTTLVDLSLDPPQVLDPEPDPHDRMFLQHLGQRVMASDRDDDIQRWVIADIVNGTATAFAPTSQRFFGRLIALPQPITPNVDGLIPGPRPATPLPGGSLPQTYEEFIELLEDTEGYELNPTFRSHLPEVSTGLGALFAAWVRRRRRLRRIGFRR